MIDISALIQNIGQIIFGKTPSKQAPKNAQNNQPPTAVPATGAITKQYTMNYFDPDENSNKVWTGMAYDTGLFETRFGRVRDGRNLTTKQKQFSSKAQAERELEKKRREKLRKGYKDTVVLDNHVETTIKKDKQDELSRIATEQIGGATDSVTAELIKYLVEVNIHHITHATSIKYNATNATFSTPLGILTPEAISDARDLLNEIQSFNESVNTDSSSRSRQVRDYFQLVPKDFGMKIPPVSELLATDEQIEEQVSILEALESAITIDTPQASNKKFFQCRLIKVPHYTDEGRKLFREVRQLYEKTRNNKHHPGVAKLKLTRLYEVEIETMKANFEATAQRIGNVQQDLWHGTKASNLLSILKNGLIIPPPFSLHCTGRMFGNGIYTSLQSTKALNYATNFWNQSGGTNQRTFMFLCEAALGKVYKTGIFSSFSSNYPATGTNSTWVKPGTSGVINHECIVYDPSQINLKYLAEFGTD